MVNFQCCVATRAGPTNISLVVKVHFFLPNHVLVSNVFFSC